MNQGDIITITILSNHWNDQTENDNSYFGALTKMLLSDITNFRLSSEAASNSSTVEKTAIEIINGWTSHSSIVE